MKLIAIIITSLLILQLVSSQISSPSPSPDLSPIHSPKPELASPAESPIEYASPPKPESEHSPSPSPSPLPELELSPVQEYYESPASSPSEEASDLNHSDIKGTEEEGEEEKKKPLGGGGMSGGTKVGVAFGTVAAVCAVGLAGFVYKKRQENLRRSRYGFAARDIL